MESGLLLLKTAGALTLVLGLLLGSIYMLRRWGNPVNRPDTRSRIEVLSKQSFGPRHHLILVEVSGKDKVLVGISPQHMSLLSICKPDVHGNGSFDKTIENI